MGDWKQRVLSMPAVAYHSEFGGIEIKDIVYGVEDSVLFVSGVCSKEPEVHSARIYYSRRPYFLCCGRRVHLDECLRGVFA